MRISIALLIFLVLLNGWGALLQEYHIDDHLGINAETGDPEELEAAQSAADEVQAGSGGVFESIVGGILIMLENFRQLINGLNPGVQMLSNIAPPGIASSLITWGFGILEIIVAADIINYVRGT